MWKKGAYRFCNTHSLYTKIHVFVYYFLDEVLFFAMGFGIRWMLVID